MRTTDYGSIIPGLTFNCESWLGITEEHIKTLQNFQDNFLRNLLSMPVNGKPNGIIQLDGGMTLMKWGIAKRKLKVTIKIMNKDDQILCKIAMINGQLLGSRNARNYAQH